jgi:hypothetical protein
MKDIFYDINDFRWSKENNSFYAEALDLYSLGDHSSDSSAFPNGKNKFYIKNFKTNDFRSFIFQEESIAYITLNQEEDYIVEETIWIYKSEDGIFCQIYIPYLSLS